MVYLLILVILLVILLEYVPFFLGIGGGYIFSFFSIVVIFGLVFFIRMPETKDKSLEQIQKELVGE